MAKNNKIQLFRTETSGSTTTNIEKGELALNINSSSPFIMFKDTSGTVQKLGPLSTSTGSSVFHTMTQKAITDALTSRKSDTDILATSLNNEIAARKAVDGQTGQTYTANTSANYIYNATSLNDADLKLDSALKTHVTIPTDYDIVYPTSDETDGVIFNNTVANDTVLESLEKVDGNVVLLVQEVLKDEEVTAAAITEIKESVGLDENLKYVADSSANYISEATTFSEADSLLDAAIKEEVIARVDSLEVIKTQISESELNIERSISTINSRIDEMDATITGNGTYVDVTVSQLDGKITEVSVAESDIASNTKLSKVISGVGLNTDGTFKVPTTAQTSGYTTAATSLMDAIIILDNQVEENETVAAYALTDLNNRLLEQQTKIDELESNLFYYSGHNTISSLTSLPITKRLCIATISSSQTLGIGGQLVDGKEIHVLIKNNSSNTITITIPSTMVNMIDENLEIEASKYGEINLVSDGTNIYYRGTS